MRDGYRTLVELGALEPTGELTEIGRQLSRLPVDPRFGRMILAAAEEGCLHEVLIIAAALAVQDPRERPLEKQEAADACHALRADDQSDFVGYLKLWDFFHKLKAELSHSQLRKACRQNFLSFNRLREWLDVHRELLELVRRAGLQTLPSPSGEGPGISPLPPGEGQGVRAASQPKTATVLTAAVGRIANPSYAISQPRTETALTLILSQRERGPA